MRVVVVDDLPGQLEGRLSWLRQLPDTSALGLTFEEAMAYGQQWHDVDVVILDGHDRRNNARRAAAATDAGVQPLPSHDRFIGPRVAQAIRDITGREHPMITLISTFARDNDLRARRIAQAGIDYVFEHFEAEANKDTFLAVVREPWAVDVRPTPTEWEELGYQRPPDVSAAIKTVESSPVGSMVLEDEQHRDHPENEWALRTLRTALHESLPGDLPSSSGPRTKRAPRKAWLSAQLRQVFGQDLPRDPD